jgi:hypothetical protein
VAIVVLVSLLVGLVSGLIIRYVLPQQYVITSISKSAHGEACPVTLYDVHGTKHDAIWGITLIDEYEGPAPFYYVRLEGLPTDGIGCPIYPDTVATDILEQGTTLYPLEIKPSILGSRLKLGESTTLATTVSINSYIKPGEQVYLVPLSGSEQIEVQPQLQTTTLDFSPSNDNIGSAKLGLLDSTLFRWVISPKTESAGTQHLHVSLAVKRDLYDENPFQLPGIEIVIETRPLIGVDPKIVAMIATAGAFLGGILYIVKSMLEIDQLRQIRQRSCDSKHNLAVLAKICFHFWRFWRNISLPSSAPYKGMYHSKRISEIG